MVDTIIQALQEYLQACPLLDGARLNVDFLPSRPLEYMISPSPVGADMALSVAGSSDEVNAVSWLGSPGPMVSTRCDINPVKG